LHRDLKPANVMIDGRGNAKITDFGIAGLAGQIQGSDVRSGTPAYMSPEQLAGREVSVRSDIYSLGLVLYELFTGRRAFDADTVTSASASRTAGQPSRPSTLIDDMDPSVERVIMRCLSDDPAQRPGSALGVAAALPGGDPLRAALEAGETPSPELVAAAGPEGRLNVRVGVGLLDATALLIASLFIMAPTTDLVAYIPKPRSAAVLADKARDIIAALGNTQQMADSTGEFTIMRQGYLQYLLKKDDAHKWERLSAGRPS